MTTPPSPILQAFGASDAPVRLAGGEGRSWVAGDLVFKRVDDEEESAWIALVLSSIRQDGFRVPSPIPARDGRWVVDGWTAWQRVDGQHDFSDRWVDVLKAGERFHAALSDLEPPSFLDRRTNPWSVGDRVAWGEGPPVVSEPFRPLIDRLVQSLRPVSSPSQVIHGDLTGNVLFTANKDPAVIDFVPYFRPVGFALAIVVVDAIAWYGAPLTLAECLDHLAQRDQLIVRAAIYRLVTADRVAPARHPAYATRQVAAHEPLAALVGV